MPHHNRKASRRGAGLRERIERSVRVDDGGCWRWQLRKDRDGYGRLAVLGCSTNLAHRLAYMAWIGEIPVGLDVDHLCRVRDCVNPAHLEAVTRKVNLARIPPESVVHRGQSAKTHCPLGHPYDELNTRINRKGHRLCKTCARTRWPRVRNQRRLADAEVSS